MTKKMSMLLPALQAASLVATLIVLLLPETRHTVAKPIALILYFGAFGYDTWLAYKRGELSMPIGQIYERFRAGTMQRTSLLSTASSVLGLAAVMLVL